MAKGATAAQIAFTAGVGDRAELAPLFNTSKEAGVGRRARATCACMRGWSPEVLVMSPGWLKARQRRVAPSGARAPASAAAPSGSVRLYVLGPGSPLKRKRERGGGVCLKKKEKRERERVREKNTS